MQNVIFLGLEMLLEMEEGILLLLADSFNFWGAQGRVFYSYFK